MFFIMTVAIFPLFVNQGFADFHSEESGITLDISTDKEAYNPGETITISGNVNPQIPGTDVILQIVSPRNNIVQIEQLEVNSNGEFDGDHVWRYGPNERIEFLKLEKLIFNRVPVDNKEAILEKEEINNLWRKNSKYWII